MKKDDLNRLEDHIDRAMKKASSQGLDVIVYILTMAKLELANEIGERKLIHEHEQKSEVLPH